MVVGTQGDLTLRCFANKQGHPAKCSSSRFWVLELDLPPLVELECLESTALWILSYLCTQRTVRVVLDVLDLRFLRLQQVICKTRSDNLVVVFLNLRALFCCLAFAHVPTAHLFPANFVYAMLRFF